MTDYFQMKKIRKSVNFDNFDNFDNFRHGGGGAVATAAAVQWLVKAGKD
jgi:hypothetical protein